MFISTGLNISYQYMLPGPTATDIAVSSKLTGVYTMPIEQGMMGGFWLSKFTTAEDTLEYPEGTVIQMIMSLNEPEVDRRKLRVNRFAPISLGAQAADLEATMERDHVPSSAIIRQLDLDAEGKFYGWEFTWNEVTFK